jgi:RTX calcium-binding nonapeptide repeat (4 copies)
MSKLARTIPVALLAALTLAASAPSGASAATQIGETFAPNAFCDTSRTRLQSVSPGGQYSAPSDGVITRWSFQAGPAPPNLRFKVGRAAPGSDLTMNADFTIVGESILQTNLAPNTLSSFFTRIPVLAGDVIGFFNATTSPASCGQAGATGYTGHVFIGDPHPGDTQTFTFQTTSKWDVSALLESDCDKDGFGDETQDSNLSSCAPGTIPPPAPTPPGQAPVTCKGLPATIVGTDGNDARTGSLGRDVIAGLGGNDTLSGLGGKDVICGGAGKDLLKGGKGADSLLGQKGKDALKGGPGKDLCKGGKGKDTATGCEVEKSI